MATSAEHLILRGLHLLIRTTFSPNEPTAQAQHFLHLQSDIGPWLSDYADEIAKPAFDFALSACDPSVTGEGSGGVQH